MPKLKSEHYAERIRLRIEQLERGESLEARDINALLTEQQRKDLKDTWDQQKILRNQIPRSKSDKEKQALGWKTIREVRIDIFRNALAELEDNAVDALRLEMREKEFRAARIFLDAYFCVPQGWDRYSAGNAALTRARLDGGRSNARQTLRDREIEDLESRLEAIFNTIRTDEERLQLSLIEGNKSTI
jgi:hypothetical protein